MGRVDNFPRPKLNPAPNQPSTYTLEMYEQQDYVAQSNEKVQAHITNVVSSAPDVASAVEWGTNSVKIHARHGDAHTTVTFDYESWFGPRTHVTIDVHVMRVVPVPKTATGVHGAVPAGHGADPAAPAAQDHAVHIGEFSVPSES